METTHLSVSKFTLFFLFFVIVLITSSCDMLTGFVIKEPVISEPIHIRCSDTAGVVIYDYCQLNESLKFMFKNKEYLMIEGVLVTVVSEDGNFEKEFTMRLEPSTSQIIELELPERYADYTYIKFRPSSYDPGGVISPCRSELIEHENIRTCVYN